MIAKIHRMALPAVAAALALAGCGGHASPSASAPTVSPTHETAHQAMVTCKQRYDAWKTGSAKTIETTKLDPALKAVESAGNSEDITALQSALEAVGSAAVTLQAVPMPSCADPAGYWPQILAILKAAGDNARSSTGLAAILLAEAPLKKFNGLSDKLAAEL